MLILSRKLNESIIIDGKIKVKIIKIDGDTIKLGIEAPSDTPVHRQEVYDEIQKNNREALTSGRPVLPRLGNKSANSNPDKKAEPQQILTK
jgi:carbon storage regulator